MLDRVPHSKPINPLLPLLMLDRVPHSKQSQKINHLIIFMTCYFCKHLLHSVYNQFLFSLCLFHIQPISSLYSVFIQPISSLNISILNPAYIQPLSVLYPAYIQSISSLYPAYIQPVYSLYPAYIQPISSLYRAYIQSMYCGGPVENRMIIWCGADVVDGGGGGDLTLVDLVGTES